MNKLALFLIGFVSLFLQDDKVVYQDNDKVYLKYDTTYLLDVDNGYRTILRTAEVPVDSSCYFYIMRDTINIIQEKKWSGFKWGLDKDNDNIEYCILYDMQLTDDKMYFVHFFFKDKKSVLIRLSYE